MNDMTSAPPVIGEHKSISLQVPSKVYWRLVNTAESESQEVSEMFYLACRALLEDFSMVEAIALRKLILQGTEEGLSDPVIGERLGLQVRKVRKIRALFGIKSAKELRALRAKS